MRIFLDANILFSAAKSDGAVRRLLMLLQQAGHQCVVDAYVVEEARRNVVAKAPAAAAFLAELVAGMERVRLLSVDPGLDATLPLPPKDRPVLSAAIRHRCAILVTGDRSHFGALFGTSLQGVAIHSPRSLAELLLVVTTRCDGNATTPWRREQAAQGPERPRLRFPSPKEAVHRANCDAP